METLYQPPPSAFGMTVFFSEDLTNYTNMIIRLGKSLFFRSITSNIKFQITDLYRFDSHTLLAANRWVGALLIDIRTGHT